jgi:hypothetical protein
MLANISFYQSNQEAFQQNYGGRYLLIIEQQVLGDFCSWAEACAQGFGLLQ